MSNADHFQSLRDELGLTKDELREYAEKLEKEHGKVDEVSLDFQALSLGLEQGWLPQVEALRIALGLRRRTAILRVGEGAAEILSLVESGRAKRLLLLAPTFKAAREIVKPLINCDSFKPDFFATRRLLKWANGAVLFYNSSEDPDLLRGGHFDTIWIEDLTKISQLSKNLDLSGATSPRANLILGVRFEPPPNYKDNMVRRRLGIILSGQVERRRDSLREAEEAADTGATEETSAPYRDAITDAVSALREIINNHGSSISRDGVSEIDRIHAVNALTGLINSPAARGARQCADAFRKEHADV